MTQIALKLDLSRRVAVAIWAALFMALACGGRSTVDIGGGLPGATVGAGGAPVTQPSGSGGTIRVTGSGGIRGTGVGGVATGGVATGGAATGGAATGGAATGGAGGGSARCEVNNGNCDALTSCANNFNAPPTCGACPSGYVGTGATVCTPTLIGLTLSSGTLRPALTSEVTKYAATVGIGIQTLTLTPTVPPGATLTINNRTVASGAAWTSPTLNLGANEISLVVSKSGHPSRNYTLTVSRGMSQEAYVKASNTEGHHGFGQAMALSGDGDTLAVGMPEEDSGATGVNGNQADHSAYGSGAVYVFTRSGNLWSQQAYIKASNTNGGDQFGYALALSRDGTTLAVGAVGEASNARGVNGNQADNSSDHSGAVYVFTRSANLWTQQAYVKASNSEPVDFFGYEVALSGDGATLAVTSPYEDSNAKGVNGDQADNSSDSSGAVYVFTRSANLWTQQAYVKASNSEPVDQFGSALALSSDGATLAIGALGEASGATGVNGNQADNSAVQSGAVYVFAFSAGFWSQQAYVKASNTAIVDNFGFSVALSGDGATLAVGTPGEDSNAKGMNGDQLSNSADNSGAVYVFTRSANLWAQVAYVKASNADRGDGFGYAVALSDDALTLAVGAYLESGNTTGANGNQANNSATGSGAAYLFTRSANLWSQQDYLKASNTEANDEFGFALALSGDGKTVAIDAVGEDSNATGVNGNEADNSADGSGAVYVFR